MPSRLRRTARFVVFGDRRDLNGATRATLVIERGSGLITARPYRQHRAYTLPLAAIARYIICQCILAEVREKQRAKKQRRFLARRGLLR